MTKIHFEIGHIFYINKDTGIEETEHLFRADTLTECIKEWKERGYSEPKYFIDVWEQAPNDVPYSIADIKIETN